MLTRDKYTNTSVINTIFRTNKNIGRLLYNTTTKINMIYLFNYSFFYKSDQWTNIYNLYRTSFIWKNLSCNYQYSYIYKSNSLNLFNIKRLNSKNLKLHKRLKRKDMNFIKKHWHFYLYSFKNFFKKLIINKVKYSALGILPFKFTKHLSKSKFNIKYISK